jgi:hypothetical protein
LNHFHLRAVALELAIREVKLVGIDLTEAEAVVEFNESDAPATDKSPATVEVAAEVGLVDPGLAGDVVVGDEASVNAPDPPVDAAAKTVWTAKVLPLASTSMT